MADLKGTNIAGTVVPFTDQDVYPTHDAQYGRGGWREVETTGARDAIPESRLRNGCVCYVEETGLPYLYKNGNWEELAFGSGDGPSGGVNLRLRSLVGTMLTTVTGTEVLIGFNFTSEYSDDGTPTGQGMAVYKVNSVPIGSRAVDQGDTYFDVAPYLVKGTNNVGVTVTDSTGISRSLTYHIEVIDLSISSTFDDTRNYEGPITYTYTPMGALTKTVHFMVNGVGVETQITEISNRQLSITIPAQTHGSHTLSVFIMAVVNGTEVTSNELYYDLICIEAGNTIPVIASAFRETKAEQYAILNIPYRVYDPLNSIASITLATSEEPTTELRVDRTRQLWNYWVMHSGTLTLKISCQHVVKQITLTITQSGATAQVVTEDLELYLTSQGRSSSELNYHKWEYESISAEFTGFNWSTNGWINRGNGSTSLRVSRGAQVKIPFPIFGSNFKDTGKTIEFEFSTREVEDYDAVVIDCFQETRGLRITAQNAIFTTENMKVETQFKEEERVRISFVVEEQQSNRIVYTYINGVISGIDQYPANDNFIQTNPVGITIGSSKCVVDIYNIRIYAHNLTSHQMVENYIADMDEIQTKLALFEKNQVYNVYGDITLPLVVPQVPALVITGKLPVKKGAAEIVSITYTNQQDPSKSFYATGVKLDIQGTSSVTYP